jgi:hypothetical protein
MSREKVTSLAVGNNPVDQSSANLPDVPRISSGHCRPTAGKTRRLAFAKVGVVTPDEARAKARKLLAEVSEGADPSAERHVNRVALTSRNFATNTLRRRVLALLPPDSTSRRRLPLSRSMKDAWPDTLSP